MVTVGAAVGTAAGEAVGDGVGAGVGDAVPADALAIVDVAMTVVELASV